MVGIRNFFRGLYFGPKLRSSREREAMAPGCFENIAQCKALRNSIALMALDEALIGLTTKLENFDGNEG